MNYYRRKLPETCVDFGSNEGKLLFIDALNTGHANIYFKLASQFRTQEEPSFCGLSTLVMVLNALEVDPGRVWKAPWRWYHESMLDCCKPQEKILRDGINLGEFHCLANCNRLKVETHYAENGDFISFKENLVKSTRSETKVMVVSYNRSALGQTGTGHFSPIGAYSPEVDRALILDVARFKYPPHWVELDDLWRAMGDIDPVTDKSRGYTLMEIQPNTRPLIAFRLSNQLALKNSDLYEAAQTWNRWLAQTEVTEAEENVLPYAIHHFSTLMSPIELCCNKSCHIKHHSPDSDGDVECRRCCRMILDELATSGVAALLPSSLPPKSRLKLLVPFMAWPYSHIPGDIARYLTIRVNSELQNLSAETLNEILQLRQQIEILMFNGDVDDDRCGDRDGMTG